ncbi:transglycosylase family protein [Streptomyces sp. NPDC088387]|uniref:transglycosylase family protein n=1 Tax=Streptomyces sp. NPDC088387 TaxID=3365859 RepID=UPI0038296309
MLPGNGRHRRPRQAPALLVAAGVTGSAIAIPLLGAAGASAASGTTWDAVAECESGGAWSADEGNGRYGGLQVTQQDWESYGGLDYAASADQASRSQQIAVAERILADQGVGAWSVCGLVHGLTQDSKPADVDTGVGGDATSGSSSESDANDSSGSNGLNGSNDSDSSNNTDGSDGSTDGRTDSSGSSDSTGSSDPSQSPDSSDGSDSPSDSSTSPSGDASGDTDPSGEPDGTDDSATPVSPSDPAADPAGDPSGANGDESDNFPQEVGSSYLVDTGSLSGTGRHRGNSADEDAVGDRTVISPDASAGSSGRHASRGSGDARDPLDSSYTVRNGDTLCSIADSLGFDGGWRKLYAENEESIGTDPNRIVPGQTLELGA